MLDAVFFKVLHMSWTASIAILLVLVMRLALSKAPKLYSYLLWSVVLFRLLCPFSFESVLSLLPRGGEEVTPDILLAAVPTVRTGVAPVDTVVNAVLPAASPTTSANPLQIWAFLGEIVWLLGAGLLLAGSVISLLRLRRTLSSAAADENGIYLSDAVETPFVLGIFSPRIYLPRTLTGDARACVLLHEQTHIRRRDPLWKLLGFLALCIHWFNPLVWAAFFLAVRDMEMSCDEAVIRTLGSGVKKTYSASLLSFAAGRRFPGGEPLAFGENDPKSRIQNVLNFKKPALWTILAAAIAVLVLCFALAANPKKAQVTSPSGTAQGEKSDALTALTFPAWSGEGSGYAPEVYDTVPFTLLVRLPQGWTAAIPPEEERVQTSPATPVSLCNAEGVHCGYAGFGVINDPGEDIPQEAYYQAVYPELRLSRMCVWDDYTPISTNENTETALSTVYYVTPVEGEPAAAWPQDTALGILHYDKSLGVWVAIYLDKDCVTEEERLAIAESVRLTSSVFTETAASLAWPTASGEISVGFSADHDGVDISAPDGTPIFAAADAAVKEVPAFDAADGYSLSLETDSGLTLSYAHCSEIYVSAGDTVKRGAVIALVGKSGMATGTILHFSVKENGVAVDPTAYIGSRCPYGDAAPLSASDPSGDAKQLLIALLRGQEGLLTFRIDSVTVDEAETARAAALYRQSELARERGLSDEAFAEGNFYAVQCVYESTWDHTLSPNPDGVATQTLYVMKNAAGEWELFDAMTPNVAEQ